MLNQLATYLVEMQSRLVPEYLLPSPIVVLSACIQHRHRLLGDVATTAVEALCGLVIALLLGALVGVCLAVRRKGRLLALIAALQSVPVITVAPLFVVWLGAGPASKAAMAATVALFPAIAGFAAAYDAADALLLDNARLCGSSWLGTLSRVRIPAGLPVLTAHLRIAAGLSVVGAIVAEMSGADRGLGATLLTATYRMETPLVFACVFLTALLGICFYLLPAPLLRRRHDLNTSKRSKS